jgi:hypothetical protein
VADEDSAKYAGGGTSLVDEVALAQGQIDSWLSRTESVDPVVALISDLSYSAPDASPASYVIADDLSTQLSADRVTAEGLLSSTAPDRVSYTTVVSQGGGAVRGFGGALGGGGSFGGLSGGGGGGSIAGMGGLEASNPSSVATSVDNSIAALSSGDSGASASSGANNSQGNGTQPPGNSGSNGGSTNGKSGDAPANGSANGTTPNGKGPATGTVTGLPNGGGSNGTGTPVQQVPEPSSVLLMALGIGAITVARRRRG